MDHELPGFSYLIKTLELGLRKEIEAVTAQESLSSVQYTALTVLAGRPGLTSSELARRSFLRPQSMAQTLDPLLKRGLVHRERDPDSNRQFLLYVTERGMQVKNLLAGPVGELEAKVLSPLTATQRRALLGYLDACRHQLSR